MMCASVRRPPTTGVVARLARLPGSGAVGADGGYIVFVLLPIYWLLNMSFQSNTEILGGLTLWPEDFTIEHYAKILTESSWYMGM